jgi:SAM-dependent methyltransferase
MTQQRADVAGTNYETEVRAGERFEFGSNWAQFLKTLDESKIQRAQEALSEMLETSDLSGKTFLDIGSGSGLSSLVARRMGAKVFSFDYDPNSVGCTQELRRRYFPNDPDWTVQRGSALDSEYLRSLGKFDIVYSWGVLHHTGAMWNALENAVIPAGGAGSKLFVAIYNFQGMKSRMWKVLKRTYCRAPQPVPFLIAVFVLVNSWWRPCVKDLLRGRPFASWREYGKLRGMTPWRDVVDWAGGYPFEVAKPEEIFNFYKARGFNLSQLKTDGGGSGCNEFVFVRGASGG